MKKLPIIFTSAALIFSSIAAFSNKQMKSAHAAETTVSWSSSSFGKSAPSSLTGTIKTGDYEWTYTRTVKSGSGASNLNSGCWQIGSQGNVENIVFETNNILGIIKEVSVECASYNNAHKVEITVGSTTYLASTATPKWTTVGVKSGTGSSSGKISISFTDGTRALYVKSISVKYDNTGAEPTYDSCSITGGAIVGSFKGTAYAECSASITGTNNPLQDVNWSITKTDTYSATSNATTATVDENGKVTFLDNGQVYVWATSKNDSTCHNDFGYSYNPTSLAEAAFTKITSIDDLYNGQSLVIGNEAGTKLMSNTQSNNNRPVVDSSCSSNVTRPTSDFQPITLGIEELENGDVVYTFNTDEGYLYAVESSNYLRSSTLSNSSRWLLSFNDGVLTIKNYAYPSRTMRFNSGSPSLISCYTTGQSPVAIFADINVSVAQKAQTFVTRFMKPVSVPITDSGTGKCISESWYSNAKTAFNELPLEVRTYIANNFTDAFVRLSTWANKNGDQMSDYQIINARNVDLTNTQYNNIYIIVIAFASASFIGLALILKRKKTH